MKILKIQHLISALFINLFISACFNFCLLTPVYGTPDLLQPPEIEFLPVNKCQKDQNQDIDWGGRISLPVTKRLKGIDAFFIFSVIVESSNWNSEFEIIQNENDPSTVNIAYMLHTGTKTPVMDSSPLNHENSNDFGVFLQISCSVDDNFLRDYTKTKSLIEQIEGKKDETEKAKIISHLPSWVEHLTCQEFCVKQIFTGPISTK